MSEIHIEPLVLFSPLSSTARNQRYLGLRLLEKPQTVAPSVLHIILLQT